jgi:hypothetical protein
VFFFRVVQVFFGTHSDIVAFNRCDRQSGK